MARLRLQGFIPGDNSKELRFEPAAFGSESVLFNHTANTTAREAALQDVMFLIMLQPQDLYYEKNIDIFIVKRWEA